MIFDRILLHKAGTKIRGRRYSDAISQFKTEKIINYIFLIKRYVMGLKEIAENIIFHTKSHGYMYFVLRLSSDFSLDNIKRYTSLLKKRQFKEIYTDVFRNHSEELPEFFLEVQIADSSAKGIVEKYKKDLEESDGSNFGIGQIQVRFW
jgi:hypothetical protein